LGEAAGPQIVTEGWSESPPEVAISARHNMPRVRLPGTRRYPKARTVKCLTVAAELVPAEHEPGQSDN